MRQYGFSPRLTRYNQDLGRKHFDRRSKDQQKRSLVKRLADLGYTVEVKPLTP
jgi:hypothetical protein